MVRYFQVHSVTPHARSIGQAVTLLREGALIAYPTDSGYALGCRMGYHEGLDRIRTIRRLNDKHHFTLVCSDFAQLGSLVILDNHAFRAIKAATPGPYTFILRATSEVPRRLAHPKKKTVGVRITANAVAEALLRELGEPILSSTLILPDEVEPLTDGWLIREDIGHLLDAVVDGGEVSAQPTTVVDYSSGAPEIVRYGAGDPSRFE